MIARDTRGAVATMAALVLVAVAAALAAAITRVAATEALLAARHRVVERALVAADACVAEVVAALPAGWELTPLLMGPDGRHATGDDGTLAAPPGCTAAVETTGTASRLLVRVEARVRGGRRLVDALVGRTPEPFDEALVWLADGGGLGPVLGTVVLERSAGAGAEDVAALAAPGPPEALDAWLASQAARVRLGPGVTAPRHAPPPPLAGLVERVRARVAPGGDGLVSAGMPPVAVTFIDGDLALPAARLGAGLLVVSGRLDIADALAFTGVVVARGGVRVASGGSLFVDGALWLGGSGGPATALDVAGDVRIRQAADAALLADRLLPLPRLPQILGIRDPG